MSTVTAVFDPSEDGTLHLPIPEELRSGKFKVYAVFTPIESEDDVHRKMSASGFGCLKGKIHLADDFDEPLADFQDYMSCSI